MTKLGAGQAFLSPPPLFYMPTVEAIDRVLGRSSLDRLYWNQHDRFRCPPGVGVQGRSSHTPTHNRGRPLTRGQPQFFMHKRVVARERQSSQPYRTDPRARIF